MTHAGLNTSSIKRPKQFTRQSKSTRQTAGLWHERLGHIGPATLSQLGKQMLPTGSEHGVENQDLSTDLGSRQAESWNLTAFGLKQTNSDPIALRSAQAELSDPCCENASGIGL
jgi:hypothetical protein